MDEAVEEPGEIGTLVRREFAEDLRHRMRTAGIDGRMSPPTVCGDADHHHAPIVGCRVAFGESVGDEALHRPGCARRVDPESFGELFHRPISAREQIECVHLARLQRVVLAEQVVA